MTLSAHKDLPQAREVCPTTTRRLLAEGALLVDVREPDEVAAIGFADCECLTIPLSQIEARWREIPRDREVIIACSEGQISLKATYFLMYQGYDRIAAMQYGLRRWAARGFPITGDPATIPTAGQGTCCGGGEPPSSKREGAPLPQ
ncbi:rhodanese-like domain-containing protein [Rhodospirillum rubrum]|uniref:rhodanese-like domain-containing protein n=1 Tax=Rhodospirillum rubrum TaxID=1085 RepID=UPI001907FFD7|nr:rhodanese-like domain-containing protein [Rhodospirillum rubrum]